MPPLLPTISPMDYLLWSGEEIRIKKKWYDKFEDLERVLHAISNIDGRIIARVMNSVYWWVQETLELKGFVFGHLIVFLQIL